MAKGIKYLIYTAVWVLLLTGCNSGGMADDVAVALPEVACRPEDVTADPPFIIAQTRTAVPNDTFLADQIENYYGVVLIENALTNTSAFCNLFEMTDKDAAIEMLNHSCSVPMEAAEPPVVGEAVCALESPGFRMVNFRQGRVVISILADLNGFGVDEWALAVNGRLPQK